LKSAFDAKNAVICGVSFDSVEDNAAFRKKFDFPFSLLCDTDKQLSQALGAAADASATHPKRITVVVAPDGKISKSFLTVKPAEHPQEVLGSL
jgi:thioredoxin-dependent peroxiredoxin